MLRLLLLTALIIPSAFCQSLTIDEAKIKEGDKEYIHLLGELVKKSFVSDDSHAFVLAKAYQVKKLKNHNYEFKYHENQMPGDGARITMTIEISNEFSLQKLLFTKDGYGPIWGKEEDLEADEVLYVDDEAIKAIKAWEGKKGEGK